MVFIYEKFYQSLEKDQKKNYIIIYETIYENKRKFLEEKIKILEKLKNMSKMKSCLLVHVKKLDNDISNLIKSSKNNFDLVLAKGYNNQTNRFIIEKTNVDFLVDPHILDENNFDFIHHFNSGLNHILAKLIKEKNINVITTLNFTKNYRSLIFKKSIGRINQNLTLFKKNKIENYFCYFCENFNDLKLEENKKDILNLFKLDTSKIKNNEKRFREILDKSNFEKSDKFISKGIKIID